MRIPKIRLGIDLGGTKIEIIALDETGKEIYKQRVSTPQGDYHATLKCIYDLVTRTEAEIDCQGSIGICTPGSISPTSGLLRNSNSTCLNHTAFLQDLQNILQRELRIANDANCFTLSEAIDGNAQHETIVFGVIIGTGCGGGIVINKVLIDGPNAITGEWGHNPLPYAEDSELTSSKCWCGKTGCIETFLSGVGFAQDYLTQTGTFKTNTEIIHDATQADTDALACLQRYQNRMARSLAHVINILDPHVIVLGGGMSNIIQLYEQVPKLWQKYVFSDSVSTKLVPPMHGDSSGVRGAAWLWDS